MSKHFDISKVKMEEHTINSANILRVAAGTTGYRGGDSGHGGRTYIEIEDLAGTDIEYETLKGKEGNELLRINLGGDSELDTIIEGLDFISETLKRQADYKAVSYYQSCPVCEDVKGKIDSVNFNDDSTIYLNVSCPMCESKWRVEYKASSIKDIEVNE